MDDLLTTTDVQDLLRLDRTTVYRMLKDGRLHGVKVGQQWRFTRRSVDALLNAATTPRPSAPVPFDLPIHCIQTVQDLFADLAGLSALAANLDGQSLTVPSGDPHHHAMLQRACAVVARNGGTAATVDGRACLAEPVLVGGQPAALIVAGPVGPERRAQVSAGLARLARALESLGRERAGMLARLNRIAALSTFAEEEPIEIAG